MNSIGKTIAIIIVLILIVLGVILASKDKANAPSDTENLANTETPEATGNIDDLLNAFDQEANEEQSVTAVSDQESTDVSSNNEVIDNYINAYDEK
jgi:ABC-type tungstate transport system permease subunit